MTHRSHALRSLKIEAWLWPPVKETGPRRRRESYLARTDGRNCQRSRRLQEAQRDPNQGLRDIEAAAIGQQVVVFEAATGRGIDEAFLAARRRLASRIRVRRGGAVSESGLFHHRRYSAGLETNLGTLHHESFRFCGANCALSGLTEPNLRCCSRNMNWMFTATACVNSHAFFRHHDDGDASARRFTAWTSGGQRLSS